MALALDTSKQLRSIDELTQLVEAISKADTSESEPDWLEWKREASLKGRRWKAIIAKYIAGFANRDPKAARVHARGCSYLVIGVEPGKVTGVAPIDNADLNVGISRFLPPSVQWSPQYIKYEGFNILIVTIEPPTYGDKIVAMLAEYGSQESSDKVCRKGDVFVRSNGRTHLATQEDYDMLVQRFSAGTEQTIGINVQPIGITTALPVACGSHEVAAWRLRKRSELLAPLRRYAPNGAEILFSSLHTSFENRSEKEYRSEVESYLTEISSLLPEKARTDSLVALSPNLQLLLINETERNFTAARVEVTIEGDIWAYEDKGKARLDIPSPPRVWGNSPFLHYIPRPYIPRIPVMPATDIFGPHIENSGSTRIEFEDVDLRPMAKVKLDPIRLVTDASLAGATLIAKWTATSASANGVTTGEFPINVSSEIVSPLAQ